MEKIIKEFYQELGKLAAHIWANRKLFALYVACFVAASHAIGTISGALQNIEFLPEGWRFLVSLAVALGLSIIAAEALRHIWTACYKRRVLWQHLTKDEINFLAPYLLDNKKTRYVITYNGTWKDSGTIAMLRRKRIIYLASQLSEYRGAGPFASDQYFPFNIFDDAFDYFKKNLKVTEAMRGDDGFDEDSERI